MLKITLSLFLLSTVASAWFFPALNFGSSDDPKYQNVDKSFVRDHNKSIVTDTKNKKMYTDTNTSENMHFYKAWEYCERSDYLGHSDWRVPSMDDIRSLLELSRRDITVKHAFNNIAPARYWSSTESRYEEAYYVDFDLGRYSTTKRNNEYKVFCVRDMK